MCREEKREGEEKRGREKEGNEMVCVKRRCLGFSSAGAFDIFSQGEDLERWPFLV